MKKCCCCGADVTDNAKFCPKCGKKMEITQDLIDRAKENDPDAQTELYECTCKTVYSRIRAKVPDEDTAMEIMKESYLCAFTNLNQLQKAESFPSWLLTLANLKVCDWYRKNGKENENIQTSQLEYEDDDTIPDEDDLLEKPEYREDLLPDESLDRAETGRLLSEILNTLPEDQRIILVMRYYDEMSLQEISDELGVNLSTVKTRLTAGREKVEAKVLELEKSGTKLYSLGPVAFLVYLLHHAELFSPAISANAIIGLTAAGEGTAAGGKAAGAAAHDKTAKTTAAAAARGISVKVAAIVAAAVIIVGGGTTATVIAANNSREASDTAAAEMYGTDPAGTSQEMFVGLTPEEPPVDEEETEPEPSEEPEVAVESEEPPAEESSQQEPEPAESEEIEESEVQEINIPSYDAVYNIVEPLSDWLVNMSFNTNVPNSSLGKIHLNTNEAVEVAGLAAATATNNGYELTPDLVDAYLKRMFGSQYQLSDFTNTPSKLEMYHYTDSAFKSAYPNSWTIRWLRQSEDGNFFVEAMGTDCIESVLGMTVENIQPNGDSTCTATVQYDMSSYGGGDGYTSYSADVQFDLIPDGGAEYGWAITSIQY